jgi:tRNA(Ile)-lysidine synthase
VPRSHPPTLITLVRATLRDHDLIPRGGTVLVAVSGGADSMALLHVLGLLRRDRSFGLFAHGVDHGLRSEAAAELDAAEAFARSLDVPFTRTRVVVPPGGNLQARARTARWDALQAAAARASADRIATGHHADDRAETMLMRILRGTRARGLAVLPPRDGDRIRPMLRARRTEILSHVVRHRIPHGDDPSNRDPRFLRVRVREELLPVLERLNPGVVDHMYALADELGVALASSIDGVNATQATQGMLPEGMLPDGELEGSPGSPRTRPDVELEGSPGSPRTATQAPLPDGELEGSSGSPRTRPDVELEGSPGSPRTRQGQ